MNFSIFLGSFASVFLVRGNLRRLREKIDNIFRDQNVSDCEEEDVLEINNFELIDLDEIEEIQGAPFKGNLFFRLFPIISISQKIFSIFFLTLEKIGIDEKVICYHNISN